LQTSRPAHQESAPLVGDALDVDAGAEEVAPPDESRYVRALAREIVQQARARFVGVLVTSAGRPQAFAFASLGELAAWYEGTASRIRYHYLAAFDRAVPEWPQPIADVLGEKVITCVAGPAPAAPAATQAPAPAPAGVPPLMTAGLVAAGGVALAMGLAAVLGPRSKGPRRRTPLPARMAARFR
jgi:hypothetical protein